MLILALDGNFRLKSKDRRSKNDPPLGDGWGHWVPQKPYQAYLEKHGRQTEVLNCSHYFVCSPLLTPTF